MIPVTQLCGDYFDYIETLDNRLCAVVADVSGHGLGAALQMVELRTLLRTRLKTIVSPAATLDEINQWLCQDLPESTFISLFLVAIDPQTRSFTYAGAGHAAWLLRRDGSRQELESTGLVLGLLDSVAWQQCGPLPMASGDLLLLTTDGITEAMSPTRELIGHERLLESAARAQQNSSDAVLETIFTDVGHFANGRQTTDDMTAIVIKAL